MLYVSVNSCNDTKYMLTMIQMYYITWTVVNNNKYLTIVYGVVMSVVIRHVGSVPACEKVRFMDLAGKMKLLPAILVRQLIDIGVIKESDVC